MQKSGLKLNKLNALACKQLERQKTILILNNSNTLLLSINGNCMEFCFILLFGGSLKQRHFAHFGKRQKLVNYRGLKWVLVCLISN